MADVKVIVKQMKDAGMSEADILGNLQELGIENAEEQMATALKDQLSKINEKENDIQITKITGESERTVDINNMLESTNESMDLMKKVSKTNLGDSDDIEDKLGQIIALLKALQDINKKILESNRDILVKLNKHQDSEKPTLGKLF
ncbi:MAG: hypothetical protein V1644_01395 [Candidatus Micrarchaeota archaeon]